MIKIVRTITANPRNLSLTGRRGAARTLLALGLLMLSVMLADARAQDSAELRRRIEAAVNALAEERDAARAEREEREQTARRLETSADDLAARRDTRRSALADLRRDAKSKTAERDRMAEIAKDFDVVRPRLVRDVDLTLERLRRRTASGVAFERERRLSAIDRLRRRLTTRDKDKTTKAKVNGDTASKSTTPRPADLLRSVVDTFSLYTAEARLFRSVELDSRLVEPEAGRRPHAYVIRLGLVGSTFVSEDDQDVGLLRLAVTPPAWTTSLGSDRSRAVRDAVDIMRRREAPRVVAFPVNFKKSGS